MKTIEFIYTENEMITIKTNDMNTTLKNKVEAILIKNGNNVNDVRLMIEEGFEYASSRYNNAKQIANYLRITF